MLRRRHPNVMMESVFPSTCIFIGLCILEGYIMFYITTKQWAVFAENVRRCSWTGHITRQSTKPRSCKSLKTSAVLSVVPFGRRVNPFKPSSIETVWDLNLWCSGLLNTKKKNKQTLKQLNRCNCRGTKRRSFMCHRTYTMYKQQHSPSVFNPSNA